MKKLRMTQQRRVILSLLQKSRSHPTAAQLYVDVRRLLPRISLGTVYRNLNILIETGQVRELRTGSAQARFDGDLSKHFHLRCIYCDELEDVHLDPLQQIGDMVRQVSGFEVHNYWLEVEGICSKCREFTHQRQRSTG